MTRTVEIGLWPAVDLKADLGLLPGRRYLLQNIASGGGRLRYTEAATAPTDSDSGHKLFQGAIIGLEVGLLGLWVWAETGSQRLAISEAT